jgi:hypothetical protein
MLVGALPAVAWVAVRAEERPTAEGALAGAVLAVTSAPLWWIHAIDIVACWDFVAVGQDEFRSAAPVDTPGTSVAMLGVAIASAVVCVALPVSLARRFRVMAAKAVVAASAARVAIVGGWAMTERSAYLATLTNLDKFGWGVRGSVTGVSEWLPTLVPGASVVVALATSGAATLVCWASLRVSRTLSATPLRPRAE